jgi:hypothetical protein
MKELFTSMSLWLLIGHVLGWIAPISSISKEEPFPTINNVTCGNALIGQVLTPGRHDALFLLGTPSMAKTDIIYDECIGPLCIFDETIVRTYTTKSPITYCIIHDISNYDIGYIRDYRGSWAGPPNVFVTASPAEEMKIEGDAFINSSFFMSDLMNLYIYKCFSLSETIQDDTRCIYLRPNSNLGSGIFADIIFKSWEENLQSYCNRIYPDWRVIMATIISAVSITITAIGLIYKIWIAIRNYLTKSTLENEEKLKISKLSLNQEGV